MGTDVSRRFGLIGAPSAAMMLAVLATGLASPARGADLVPPVPPQADDLWTRDKLTGDWGGARTNASKHGLDITFNYVGEALGVLAGGFRQGVSYEHRFE